MMKIRRKYFAIILAALAALLMSNVYLYAQQADEVQINTEKIGRNLFLLQDSGGNGNTAVLAGDDGVLVVDTKSKPAADQLLAKINELSGKKIRFAVNTHWHFDHVGGNKQFHETGAVIVAQENVRKHMGIAHDMKLLNVKVAPAPEIARPMLTFKEKTSFYLNEEDIEIFHVAPGHTDGDAVVYFKKADVIHMGDLYFEGIYPYIGIYSGGSISGMINAINHILPKINDNTKVIPGHGPLSNKAKLREYVSMLADIRDHIGQLMKNGYNLEKVIAAKPTEAYDEKWGNGFLQPDKFAQLVYMDLSPDLP